MTVFPVRPLSSFHNATRFHIAITCTAAALVACNTAYAGEVAHRDNSYVPPPAQVMSTLPPAPSNTARQVPAALVRFELSFPKPASGSPLQPLYGSSALAFEHAIHAGTSRLVTNPVSNHTAPLVTEELVLTYAGQSRDWISLHLAYEQLTTGEDPGRPVSRPVPIAIRSRFDTDVTLPICPADRHCTDALVTLGDSGARLRLSAMPYDSPLNVAEASEK